MVLDAVRAWRDRGTSVPLPKRPISRKFGLDRGLAIDRYYIERFLTRERQRIRGRVLEIGDDVYTSRFGSTVQSGTVLKVDGEPGEGVIVGDLTTGSGIPERGFDCLILTQTLPFIFDVEAAVKGCHRALTPGGAVLATLPGISQISRYDMDRWGDYWRFTDLSARRLFGRVFGEAAVQIEVEGNVGVACAFLQGLAVEDIDRRLLDPRDRDYQLVITVVATRRPD